MATYIEEGVRVADLGPLMLNDFGWEVRPRRNWAVEEGEPGCMIPPLDTFCQHWFERKLEDKFDGCGQRFLQSVRQLGIQEPITILFDRRELAEAGAEGPGRPTVYEGHHRFAVSYFEGIPAPIRWITDEHENTYERGDRLPYSDGSM